MVSYLAFSRCDLSVRPTAFHDIVLPRKIFLVVPVRSSTRLSPDLQTGWATNVLCCSSAQDSECSHMPCIQPTYASTCHTNTLYLTPFVSPVAVNILLNSMMLVFVMFYTFKWACNELFIISSLLFPRLRRI